jgi:hypothetical protein
VCDSDIDFDFDQLVSCDMCGITVHQSCYGVAELPGVDDMWLCRACELKVRALGTNAPPQKAAVRLCDWVGLRALLQRPVLCFGVVLSCSAWTSRG